MKDAPSTNKSLFLRLWKVGPLLGTHGCGCQNQWDPILVVRGVLTLVGIGMFTGGTGF